MIPSTAIVDFSRLQFAFTAMFHFLFVPLTLGLTWLLVVMESCYLITGKTVYRDMTQFWGKLLAINFAIGVVTGITMEFEFGVNWSYFSRTIGGSFGPILAIEGITAFMLEATMFGLFFFSWDKLSRYAHCAVTFFLALGASLSIVNILAANSWMQHPVAAALDAREMSVNLESIAALYLNSLAQARIGHVAFAGFVTGTMFVLGISAFYLLKKRDVNFAKRSFAAAAGFGLIAIITVAFFGDMNGLEVSDQEPEKMAAIEAQWETQTAPAAWYLIAFPDQKNESNHFVVKIPYVLSLIATHSLTGTVTGGKEIEANYINIIKEGVLAYEALMNIRMGVGTAADEATFEKYRGNIGFAYLLKRYTDDLVNATPEQIAAAAKDGLPGYSICFWSFRVMLAAWGLMFLLIVTGFYFTFRNTLEQHPLYLRMLVYAIPLPWIAAEAGWLLAESGRQPWIVHHLLPTYLGTSSITLEMIISSLIAFILVYALLICVELTLMFKFARKGPSSLATGRYHYEQKSATVGETP